MGIEAKNKIKNTPLHCAVYAGHVETVKCILQQVDDERDALLAVNGVNLSAVKYTAHDEMKQYLRRFFPKKESIKEEENQDDRQEEEAVPSSTYEKEESGGGGQNEVDDVEDEEADETTGLKSGTATATEQ